MKELPKNKRIYLGFKRVFSFINAIIFSLLISPIFIIVLIISLIDMKGHPFYKQERYGKNRKVFNIYKFRTYIKEGENTSTWGRFLRFTSLDEIPQMLNILKGEMNFIGPRPLSILEKDMDEYRKEEIYLVNPGLTGYAQLHYSKDSAIDVKVEYDRYYIHHLSYLLDIKIIFFTLVKLLPISIHRK